MWPRIQLAFWAASTHSQLTCNFSSTSTSQKPTLQGRLQSIHHPVCIDTGDCAGSGAGPWTWLFWTAWVLYRPAKVPLDDIILSFLYIKSSKNFNVVWKESYLLNLQSLFKVVQDTTVQEALACSYENETLLYMSTELGGQCLTSLSIISFLLWC